MTTEPSANDPGADPVEGIEPIDPATEPLEPAGAVQAAEDPPAVGEERATEQAGEFTNRPAPDPTAATPAFDPRAWGGPALGDLLEQARARTAARQPVPWRPEDDDLDPTSDTGWEKASEHELIAVRPEDIPAVLSTDRAGAPFAAPSGAPAVDAAPVASVWSPRPAGAAAAAQPSASTATTSWTSQASDWPTTSTVWGPPPSTPVHGSPGTLSPAAAAAAAAGAGAAATPPIAEAATGAFTPTLVPPVGVPAAPPDTRWRRGTRRVRRGFEAAARPFLMLAIFGLGASLGWYSWVRTLPPVVAASQPATRAADTQTTDQVPIQVQSLIAAIDKDDQQQIQVVVPADAYRVWVGEIARWNLASLSGAQPYRTFVNGTNSATELLIFGTTTDGSPIAFNLVVHIHDGVISDFR
jgi:hypothetical protein